MNKIERRQNLFDHFSRNLKNVFDSQNLTIGYEVDGKRVTVKEPIYICPICFCMFSSSDLDQSLVNPLTLEDVPPKKLGGKPNLLTCKKCNNKSGDTLDNHLKTGLNLSSFIKDGGEISSRLGIRGNRPFQSKLSLDKMELKFQYSSKNPYASQQIKSIIEDWDGSEIKFSINGPNERNFLIGLLRIAYLLAFKHFGYSYIFTDGAKMIRSQIIDTNAEIIKKPLIVLNKYLAGKEGVHLIKPPNNLKAICVVFKLKQKKTIEYYGVFLPGPNKEHIDSYLNYIDKKEYRFHFLPLDNFDFKADIKGFHQMWTIHNT